MDLWFIKSTLPYGSRHRRRFPNVCFKEVFLIRASRPAWGEDALVTWQRRTPKGWETERKNINVDHISLEKQKKVWLFDFFFNASMSLKPETLRRCSESDPRRPLRKEPTPGGKECSTMPQQSSETQHGHFQPSQSLQMYPERLTDVLL